MSFISNLIMWAPATYYSVGVANILMGPTLIKMINGPTKLIKEFFPTISHENKKLRNDISIYQLDNIPHAAQLGANFGLDALIYINPKLDTIDSDALSFICKHELGHIYNNDTLIASSVAVCAASISIMVVPYIENFLPWWISPVTSLIPFLVAKNFSDMIRVCGESRADDFALKNATPEEMQGIIRFLSTLVEVNKELHVKFPKLFTEMGDVTNNLDVIHPPDSFRLELFINTCVERNIELPKMQPEEIETFKQFHRDNYKKCLKIQID